EAWQLEHRIEQDRLHDRAQTACPGLPGDRLLRDAAQRLVGQLEAVILHLEQSLVLLDQGVLRFGQNIDEGVLVEIVQGRDHWQAADEFGNKAKFQQILRFEVPQDLAGLALVGAAYFGAEADRGALPALGDDLLKPREGAAADEEDVRRVDLQELLLRVLAAALRRHRGDGALHDLEERLLHPLARDVTGDRRVVGFARDLVDLVDVDNAALRPLDVVVGRLQKLQDDVLDILADIARFGQRRRVGHRKRHVDDPREGLRQQRL